MHTYYTFMRDGVKFVLTAHQSIFHTIFAAFTHSLTHLTHSLTERFDLLSNASDYINVVTFHFFFQYILGDCMCVYVYFCVLVVVFASSYENINQIAIPFNRTGRYKMKTNNNRRKQSNRNERGNKKSDRKGNITTTLRTNERIEKLTRRTHTSINENTQKR